jgi:triosephosphate isomerase
MTDGRRIPIIGGNWKMNTTLLSAIDLAENLVREIGQVLEVEMVLCPPFPNLEAVRRVIDGSALQLGAQDVYWEQAGAFTGEVSAPMLRSVGCEWVIVGHSERRHLMGETSAMVNRKLKAALHEGLRVILAVGETREERHAGHTELILESQLRESLADMEGKDIERMVIAYEPVWAIGTGDTATPDQAREAHAFVRLTLGRLCGQETASAVRIQYGGSVTAQNAAELMSQPGVDGALVGGASLKAEEFAAIVRAAIPQQ